MNRLRAAFVLSCVLLCGCADDAGAWMHDVRTWSAQADAADARGDRVAAIDALSRIVERQVPESVAAEDARVVRQDACARLAERLLEHGDPERAARVVAEGLALGEREDLFTANLLTVQGLVHEGRGDDREAARAYHRALLIQEALLERALGGDE